MNAFLEKVSDSQAWTGSKHTLESALPHSLKPWTSSIAIAILVATGYLVWTIGNAVYNLYFHPLAKFPGPWEAALSKSWIYKNSMDGRVEQTLEKLHKQYGSHAIRISPNELHITDVSLYKKMYSQNDPWTKDGDFYAAFGTPHSVFVETDHNLHKVRRKLLNPFFSRAGVLNTQSLMKQRLRTLKERLEQLPAGFKVNLYNAFRCLTVDIISDYASGKCLDQVSTSDDSFFGSYLEAFDAAADITWDMCYKPMARLMVAVTPPAIAKRISNEARAFLRLVDANRAALGAYRANPNVGRPVVYSALDGCNEVEAVAEAADILAAGSDTTAYSLTIGLWHIMSNPELRKELAEALLEAIPDPDQMPELVTLEKIPILTATVKECVRVAAAVPGRLPRIVPEHAALFVDGRKVPAGTVVGMSAYTMHRSQELWGPNATEFNPHRWLKDDGAGLEQNMVSFSKGRRSCIGQNLAFAEIHLVLACLFRNFDFELAPGSATPDGCDRFTAMVRKPGVLAYITKREK